MSGVAIVAIPNKSDPVWAVSSEKIPHMTLLFLGDALSKEDYRQVQEFVTHVADVTLPSFGMSVDKRDTLGDSDADVLFFKNNDKSRISLFRSYLLQDSIIREAYESVEQFEGWTPHLTLGYPETPAKKDPREDNEFYWINFDRIMIWTGDYEGPEIELKSEDLGVAMDGFDEDLGLSQSDHEAGLAFLAQSGVKGMRWGVRKSQASQERSAARSEKKTAKNEKAAAKLVKIQTRQAKEAAAVNRANARKAARVDKPGRPGSKKEWVQKSMSQAKAKEVLDAASPRITKDLTALVKTMPNRPLKGKERRAYDRQALGIINKHLDTAARAVVGVSPNGRKTATASMTPNGTLIMRVTRTTKEQRDSNVLLRGNPAGSVLAQAELDVSYDEFEFDIIRNENGFIEGFEMIKDGGSVAQSDLDFAEEFLAHVGVKGMRWGVRRSAEERRAARTDKVQSRAEKSIARSAELKARAEARTSAADAKAAASTAKLETKVAKKEAKLAKTEARIGVDDPSNAYVRPSSGVAGKTNAESVRLRSDAAKSARTLDDATLKAYTQRIDSEQKLKKAIAEDASPKKTAAKKLINEAGKDIAKTALVGVGSLAVYYALGRMSKTHDIKPNAEGIASVLTKGKSNTKDGFSSVEKMAELAGGKKVPLSEIAKWNKPKSMGPNAKPF